MNVARELVRHLRLVWRLFWTRQVRWWHRFVLLLPIVYFVIPLRYDLVVDLTPLLGLVDDWMFWVLCSYIFVAVCPRSVVRRERLNILSSDVDPNARDRARAQLHSLGPLPQRDIIGMHRYPRESPSLCSALAILVLVTVLGGIVSVLLLFAAVTASLVSSHIWQRQLMRRATEIAKEQYASVHRALNRCWQSVPKTEINLYVIPDIQPRAVMLGLDEPYSLILTTAFIEKLDQQELTAALAHELGHILYEHSFLSFMLGGMLYRAGLVGKVWAGLFQRWCRFAEHSADRVALLVCRDLDTCVSMILKVERVEPGELTSESKTQEQLSTYFGTRQTLNQNPWADSSLAKRVQELSEFDAELFALQVEEWLGQDAPA